MDPAGSVSAALSSRRSVRAFTAQPVDDAVLQRVIARASLAPSGGNLQPWHLYVLRGRVLDDLKTIMTERVRAFPEGEAGHGEGVEYNIYPSPLQSPYKERRVAFGEALYGSLGIARDDAAARRAWHERNYRFFDAPVGLFCYVERGHGKPQWADLGMYLMSLMLLLREEGLHSCPQECWARYARSVDAYVQPAEGMMLFCGVAIGHADLSHSANQFPRQRAPVREFATFLGDP
ncbi:nitroreductase [Bordetella sp. BOR01]|uniref:nitroreductase n=1 Tax=Bordetella sp. BOR01 TaxID=2854779 RepID=UPI001C440B8B|nr:nitroreductase [Bordetella sp. BOR01]MBV7482114.1 nitroreductase [Bordetella sp. BOR01]